MKKLLMATMICSLFFANAQTSVQAVSIMSKTINLNGGARAIFGSSFGAASRQSIQIRLPANTIEWYYSFTATSGTDISPIKLFSQITSLLAKTNFVTAIASSVLTDNDQASIEVPLGQSPVTAYIIDSDNSPKFLAKNEFIYMDGTATERTTQGLVKVPDITEGTWYLGLINVSSIHSANVKIEVVAIVSK